MREVLEILTAFDGTQARLTKHGRNDFSLTIISKPYDHNRWGTREEIDADIRHFLETGALPYEKQRWF